jgi:hypothetical protein
MEQDNVKVQSSQSKEIDLLDLFQRMWQGIMRGLKILGSGLLMFLFFCLRKSLYLFIALLLGIGASYLIKMSAEKVYSSTITLRSNAVSTSEMIDAINKLFLFTETENFEALESALGISGEVAGSVKQIQAFWVIDINNDNTPDYVDFRNNHNPADTVNVRMQDRFVVRVRTANPGDLFQVREGLLFYVNSNELFQQQNDLRLVQLEERLARVNYEIFILDSLQKVKYFEETRNRIPEKGGQFVFLQEQKTQLLYGDIQYLYGQKQSFETQREIFSDIVTVLSDFAPSSRADNNFRYYANRVVPIFLVITLLILFYVDHRRKVMEFYQKF